MTERTTIDHQTYPPNDLQTVKDQLRQYGEENGLRGLEGRIERGLDPAGLLAVQQTREKVEQLASAYGASMTEVERLTNDLHVGGVWQHGSELATDSPEAAVWIALGEVTVQGKRNDLDGFDDNEFLEDYSRIKEQLDLATADPQAFRRTAREHLIARAAEQFRLDGDVPVSDKTEGFLAMALSGHRGGVVIADTGLMFVGAERLKFDQFARDESLQEEVREDRGREVVFYVKEGHDVVKKLYPGFAIVLTGDLEVAKALARTADAEGE